MAIGDKSTASATNVDWLSTRPARRDMKKPQ